MLNEVLSFLVILLVMLLFAAALLIARGLLFGRLPDPVEPFALDGVDERLVAGHLAETLRIQTISESEDEPPSLTALVELQFALEKMYPRLHAVLKRERVGEASLLYAWVGRSADLEPVMLCAHLDVVPVDPTTRADWKHAPFSGDVAGGFVWGRGALDMKSTLIGIFEAVEGLIRAGFQPERTLYIALGHDEEIGGFMGARGVADLLAQRGERLAALLDEGAAVVDGMIPGMPVPVALIGVAEKGYATFELKVEGRGGHSSLPPRHTAVGVLARAVTRIEQNPMPAHLGMARMTYTALAALLPFSMRLALANPAFFGRALARRIEAAPHGRALSRTSTAVTMIGGGTKDNLLPSLARAAVNCRLYPGDTRAAVEAHLRRVIGDEAVQISLVEERSWEAVPLSPLDGDIYQSLARTIRQVFPEAAAAPYLVIGATDSRHYGGLCARIYRFTPMLLDAELLKTIHGVDERIAVDNLPRMVAFYHRLIQTWVGVVEEEAA